MQIVRSGGTRYVGGIPLKGDCERTDVRVFFPLGSPNRSLSEHEPVAEVPLVFVFALTALAHFRRHMSQIGKRRQQLQSYTHFCDNVECRI